MRVRRGKLEANASNRNQKNQNTNIQNQITLPVSSKTEMLLKLMCE